MQVRNYQQQFENNEDILEFTYMKNSEQKNVNFFVNLIFLSVPIGIKILRNIFIRMQNNVMLYTLSICDAVH